MFKVILSLAQFKPVQAVHSTAALRSQPNGSSKFKVQKFKVIFERELPH